MSCGRDPVTTVGELLAARSADEPARTALLMPDGRRMTFAAWDERATALAHRLAGRGVRVGDRVGLRFGGDDWLAYAVSYVAVQRAGGVAVPLSARQPAAQVRDVLADCAAVGLLQAQSGAVTVPGAWSSTVDGLADPAGPVAPLPPVGPQDVAQIVYTSGTTGRPKGVVATHANVTHGYPPHPRRRRFAHSETLLHAFPIGTNGGQTMLVYALAARPAVLSMPEFDSTGFCALVERHRVGTVFLVPSLAVDLLATGAPERHDLSSVVLLTSSAAALPPAVAGRLAEAFPNATVVNYYTSTESAPADTTMIVDPARPASVGRPADPADVLVLDESGRPVRPGETGEVWLRSPATPRAYFGDPAATAATFRDGRVRMGDLGYVDADGYLFLVDRAGDVVKSGGLKVSTLQVEAALHEHPAVAEAAVLGLPHPVLGWAVAAAVVPRAAVTAEELRAFLVDRLARHEVPTRLLLVDALPHNEIGKVLKPAVRELFAAASAGAAPGTATELALADLWRQVLGVRDVRADDDFFALGGESLRATQLATRASETFGVPVNVSLLFAAPTLTGQAASIAALTAEGDGLTDTGVPDAPVADGVPAAQPFRRSRVLPRGRRPPGREVSTGSTQEYFLEWMHAGPDPRQIQPMSLALRMHEDLDAAALGWALTELASRHEALRTRFTRTGDGFAARLVADAPVELRTVPVPGDTAEERQRRAYELACEDVERRFDVTRGPLVRALLLRLAAEEQILVLVIEHLVFDGRSFGVFLRELGLLYSARRLGQPALLPDVPVQASAVAARARRQWPGNGDFWRRTLAGAPLALSPLPGHDPTAARYLGATVEFTVPAEAGARLRRMARDRNATAFMATLAAWCAVLRDWTGARDIVVQAPVTGRVRIEDEPVVGCLVQLLMLRIPVVDDFGDLLDAVRTTVVDAVDHQVHRFSEVAAMVPFPVHFFFESWGGPAHLPGVESEPLPLPPQLALTWTFGPGEPDLSAPRMSLVEHPDGTTAGRLLYNTEAYDRTTVVGLAEAFQTFIGGLG